MPGKEQRRDGVVAAVHACLAAAKTLTGEGKYDEAEKLYLKALDQAEDCDGEFSILVCLVLLDLFHLYQEQGRVEESQPIWEKIRKILTGLHEKHFES
jgi:tetratricopeptide (TPR) repeat protein